MVIEILLYIYFGMMLLVGLFFITALVITGGPEEFAQRANVIAGEEKFTSNKVQWNMVFVAVFWFVIPFMLALRKA